MSKIETKEIGIDTGIESGTYHNTERVDGSVQLRRAGETKEGEVIYHLEGYWESEIIDLVGKFKEYDKIALSKKQGKKDKYAILTRVSSDKKNFSEYVATTPDGRVQSKMKRYIQIKLVFYAGLKNQEVLISYFNSPESVEEWANNQFVETGESLKLKKDFLYDLNKDNSWSEEGSLHRKKMDKNNWGRIDSMEIRF